MAINARFCPQCGTARVGAFRYCRECRFDFDASAAGVPAPPPPAIPAPLVPIARPSADNLNAPLAGVAWLAAAAILAYLAYSQWSVGSALASAGLPDGNLRGVAAWNVVSALLTAYFGARCLRDPDKGFLRTSVAWAVLNVALGVYQLTNGVGDALFALTIIASALAGVLSFAAREAAPVSKGAA